MEEAELKAIYDSSTEELFLHDIKLRHGFYGIGNRKIVRVVKRTPKQVHVVLKHESYYHLCRVHINKVCPANVAKLRPDLPAALKGFTLFANESQWKDYYFLINGRTIEEAIHDANTTMNIHICGNKPEDYETLEIPTSATKAEAKKAFRKLAMKHHPDRGGDADDFHNIKSAYEDIR